MFARCGAQLVLRMIWFNQFTQFTFPSPRQCARVEGNGITSVVKSVSSYWYPVDCTGQRKFRLSLKDISCIVADLVSLVKF